MMLRVLTLALSMTSILGACSNYTILSDSWRNVYSPRGLLHCDYDLTPGTWYRFMPPAGIAIPETIPPIYSCGTNAPMWLNGTHPRNVSSVPVERQLCANWEGDPCRWSTTIKVALCPGNYYIYMAPVSAVPTCQLAWCAVDASPRGICEQQGNFYCSLSQLCVASYHRCNGYSYCSYGEDEAGCNSSSTAPTIDTNGTLSPRGICEQQGNFYCSLSQLCVASYHRCNGYSYCPSGEDEAGCNSSSTAPTTVSSSPCGGTLYGSGYVRSPYYPSNYNNNLLCNWTLIASPYYGNILLEFYAFSTESCCDFLSIYNSSGALVNRYSGSVIPSTIFLGSYAVVSFSTDSSVVSSGFSIWFSTSVAPTTTLSPRDSCEQQGYFYCALSNLCIAFWRRCDGSAYCYYGEDEAGCGVSSTVRTSAITPSQRESCLRQGNFYCEFSRECIPMWRRCDGYTYCYYGEDESGCGSTTASFRPDTSRTAASEPPQGSFIAVSGFAQAFLQLSKSSACELPRGSWSVVSGYVAALLLALSRFWPALA